MVERKQPEHKNEIAWGLFLAGAALAFPVITGGASLYIGLRDDLADIRLNVSSSTQWIQQHPMSGETRDKFREIENTIRECQNKLAELSSTVNRHGNP